MGNRAGSAALAHTQQSEGVEMETTERKKAEREPA